MSVPSHSTGAAPRHRRAVSEPLEARLFMSTAAPAAPGGVAAVVAAAVTPAAVQRVSGFKLINTQTDQPVADLVNGSVVNLATLPGGRFDVRADTSPGTVGSVRFTFTGQPTRTENSAPYALFADNKGDYAGRALPPGQYTLRAVPFTGRNAGGTRGEERTVQFTLVNNAPQPPQGPAVTGLVLADARPATGPDAPDGPRNTVIRPLADNATVDLASLPTRRLNVLAQVAPGAPVGSVRLELDGRAVVRTRHAAPYGLFGDNDPFIAPALFTPGQHTLKATAFTGPDGTGAAGAPRTIRLNVTDSAAAGGLQVFIDFDRDGSLADEAPLGGQMDELAAVIFSNAGGTSSGGNHRMLLKNAGAANVTLSGAIRFPADATGPRPDVRLPTTGDSSGSTRDDTVILNRFEPPDDRPPAGPGDIRFALFDPLDLSEDNPTTPKVLVPGEALGLVFDAFRGGILSIPPAAVRSTDVTVDLAPGQPERQFTVTAVRDPSDPPDEEPASAASAATAATATAVGTTAANVAQNLTAAPTVRLTVRNVRTDQPVLSLADGAVVNLTTLPGGRFSIDTDVDPFPVGGEDVEAREVRFTLDGTRFPSGTPLFGGGGTLLSNDSGGGPSSFPNLRVRATPAQGVTNGALVLNEDGSFVYTPDRGFVGQDSFVYTLEERDFNSNVTGTATARVTLNVGRNPTPPAADPAPTPGDPVARNDSYNGPVNQPIVGGFGVGGTLLPGPHTLTVESFAEGGAVGPRRTVRFTVVQPATTPAVTGLSLVDNRGGGFDPTVIRSLANGATLDLNLESLPTRILNVRADAGGAVGSVRLSVDGGKVVRVRNAAPYALFGDNDAPGGPGLFTPGEHTVAVTPFRGRDATGAAGATQTFRFRVRDTYEDGTGFALFVDLDSDGSTADEAPTGNQDDDQENTGNETRTQAFFRNNGSAPLTLEGDLTFFPGDGEQDDSGFFLGLPSLPNLGDAADQEDDLLYLDANDFTVPQGARGAVYGFFRTTPGGGRLSDRVTLAAGESLSFDVINDGDGGRNKAGVSPAPKSPKPKKFGGFS